MSGGVAGADGDEVVALLEEGGEQVVAGVGPFAEGGGEASVDEELVGGVGVDAEDGPSGTCGQVDGAAEVVFVWIGAAEILYGLSHRLK